VGKGVGTAYDADPMKPGTRRAFVAAAALLPWTTLAAKHPSDALRLGLVPYLSTRQMLNVFEPLREHLQTRLGRPVVLFTAADLTALGVNTRNGDYDIAFMPAHFMRLAAQDWSWHVLARSVTPTHVVLAGRQQDATAIPDGLRGQRIVSLDAVSITSMVLLDWLRDHKLMPGKDVVVEYIVTASSVLRALERPEVRALAIVEPALADMSVAQREQIKVVARMATVPAPGYVAHPRLTAAERDAVQAALLSFGGTASGAGSLSRATIVPASLTDLDGIERYSRMLRQAITRAH
jgi:phosphonate transport system substrate-binding protein